MSGVAIHRDELYTWDDYRTWSDDERWELIGGQALSMSPSPTSRHQRISAKLLANLDRAFEKGPCMVFAAPMDVKLSDEDVVQPDLLVVCRPEQIKSTHIEGPPSLVVEILSVHSLMRDRHLKMDLYAHAGVREYWIVTPFPSLVEVYELSEGHFRHWKSYKKEETLGSPSFSELRIALASVFDFPLEPDEVELFRVRESPARYQT